MSLPDLSTVTRFLDHVLGYTLGPSLILAVGLFALILFFVVPLDLLGEGKDRLERRYYRLLGNNGIPIGYRLLGCIVFIVLVLGGVGTYFGFAFLLETFRESLDSARFSTMYEGLAKLFVSWGTDPFFGSLLSAISVIAWWIGIVSGLITIYEFTKRKLKNTTENNRPPTAPHTPFSGKHR